MPFEPGAPSQKRQEMVDLRLRLDYSVPIDVRSPEDTSLADHRRTVPVVAQE
jgi:hypothetical protein